MPRRPRSPARRGSLVLLDTNAAFLPFREGLPLEEEVGRLLPGAELAVPVAVRAELDRLVDRGAPLAAAARSFVRRLRPVRADGRGDRAVRDAAIRLRATVVTADRALAGVLRRCGVAVLAPRGRSHLELQLPRPPAGPLGPGRERRSPAKR